MRPMCAHHQVDVLVIGAGPTGIGAATRLHERGTDWLLVEAAAGPGGMATSITDDQGFVWDLGGHVLHSHFDSFDRAVAASGVTLLSPTRNGQTWIDADLAPAPVQHQLDEIPTDLRPDAPAENLDDYYRNHLGSELHARFFRPYTEKMWAAPLPRIDHTWTSLRNGSAARNVPSVRLRGEPAPRVTFPYPAGGTGALWVAITAPLPAERLRFGVAVTGIDLTTRTAHLSDGDVIRFTDCVSSMPLTTLARSVDRPDLAELTTTLLANAVICVGLGFTGPPPDELADVSWIYCPDKDVAWHRATVLSNYDPANAGRGRWSVLFETGTSPFRVVGREEAVASCQESVVRLGAEASSLVSTWVMDVALGYPLPTLGRDPILRTLDAALGAAGVRSRGRFGGWRYESCNQDYSFAQGVEAVDAMHDGTPEDVYWHPERF